MTDAPGTRLVFGCPVRAGIGPQLNSPKLRGSRLPRASGDRPFDQVCALPLQVVAPCERG